MAFLKSHIIKLSWYAQNIQSYAYGYKFQCFERDAIHTYGLFDGLVINSANVLFCDFLRIHMQFFSFKNEMVMDGIIQFIFI